MPAPPKRTSLPASPWTWSLSAPASIEIIVAFAVQGVGPGAPDQPVIAVAAVEEVGAGLAGEGIVAGAALEQVVAGLAADDVADGVAGDVVVVAGAVQVLDVDQRVVLGVAAEEPVGLQVDRDPGARALVVGEIRTGAAVDGVAAGAAAQRVVAVAAIDGIDAVEAHQQVGQGRAGDDVVAGEDGGKHRHLVAAADDEPGQGRQGRAHGADGEDQPRLHVGQLGHGAAEGRWRGERQPCSEEGQRSGVVEVEGCDDPPMMSGGPAKPEDAICDSVPNWMPLPLRPVLLFVMKAAMRNLPPISPDHPKSRPLRPSWIEVSSRSGKIRDSSRAFPRRCEERKELVGLAE